MKSQHSFNHSVGEKVRISSLEKIPARIEMMSVGPAECKSYRVAYWDRGERQTAWIEDDEMEPFGG